MPHYIPSPSIQTWLNQKSDWTIIHILGSIYKSPGYFRIKNYFNVSMCNLSKEQINTCRVCKSPGELTANAKLHYYNLFRKIPLCQVWILNVKSDIWRCCDVVSMNYLAMIDRKNSKPFGCLWQKRRSLDNFKTHRTKGNHSLMQR